MPIAMQLGSLGKVQIDRLPDHCPICHTSIVPQFQFGAPGGQRYGSQAVIVYRCPSARCGESFFSYFERRGQQFFLIGARPAEPEPPILSDFVRKLSHNYCDIYTEAHAAEELGLRQICGVGYRKALEFLIKDYLIARRPNDTASIETTFLGPCIENYVADANVKAVAKRAVWLGNDEAHYQRRWLDKDLNDLKALPELVVRWIETEHLTEETIKSMQPQRDTG